MNPYESQNMVSNFFECDEGNYEFKRFGDEHFNILRTKSQERLSKLETIEALSDGNVIGIETRSSVIKLDREFGENIHKFRVGKSTNQRFGRPNVLVCFKENIKPEKILGDFLSEEPELLLEIAKDSSKFYHSFRIKKNGGGTRQISAPNEDLKRIQNKILKQILYSSGSHTNSVHGFVRGRSIKSNAAEHLRSKVLIKMDLQKFFDTIDEQMTRSAFFLMLKPLKMLTCTDLVSKLCLLNGSTPQGAPTSPAITNAVCIELDLTMKGLAGRHGAKYTRYADDLTFSSVSNQNLNKIIPIVKMLVEVFGFKVNNKKTGVFRNGGRMPVTGIVVNQHLNVSRKKRMNFRAKLHNIITGKIPLESVNFDEIQGFANFINMVNPQQGERFLSKIKIIKEMLNK